jgi:hypothetical protein
MSHPWKRRQQANQVLTPHCIFSTSPNDWVTQASEAPPTTQKTQFFQSCPPHIARWPSEPLGLEGRSGTHRKPPGKSHASLAPQRFGPVGCGIFSITISVTPTSINGLMTRAFLGSQFWECSWEGMLPKLDGDDGGSQFVQELFCCLLPIFRPLWFKIWRSPITHRNRRIWDTFWDTETEGGATPRSRKTWVETHRNSADLHWVHVSHLMPDC